MKRIFICSPFSGPDRSLNIERAQQYCLQAINEGAAPFAPHLLYPQFLDESPKQRELGMDAGKEFLKCCHEVWVFGEKISVGMQEEITLANYWGIEVINKPA